MNGRGEEGRTAVIAAAHGGHSDSLKLLLAAGADVNATNDYDDTALIHAAFTGREECVHILVEAAADVNSDGSLCTALIWAASYGYIECLEYLIEAGADVKQSQEKLLHCYSSRGCERSVRVRRLTTGIRCQCEHGLNMGCKE